MHSASVLRRRVPFAVVALLAFVGLVMAMSLRATADATPAYPPTSPCSSSANGVAMSGSSAGSTCSPSHGIEPAATHRSSVPDANSNDGAQNNHGTDSGTAVTGFAALTATVVAVLLLGGGVLFLAVGRRRNS